MIIDNLEARVNKRKNVLLKFRRIWVHLFSASILSKIDKVGLS